MKIVPTGLDGVSVLYPDVRADQRGFFIKPFEKSFFAAQGWETDFGEIYYSVSAANVLRGLHVQVPPAHGAKLVGCVAGKVFDVLLDLRKASPTFGQHITMRLDGAGGEMVYMPAGIAHGFLVEEGPATLFYYQHAAYAPDQDKGIAWDSAGIAWPCAQPVMSDRDKLFPPLAAFETPF